MSNQAKIKINKQTILKILGFFTFLFSLQILVTYTAVSALLLNENKDFVTNITTRVEHDLKYENGQWDTTLYNSDPLTPYPNASSSFPLYIITADGFVIERSKPINGFLDTSNLKQLLAFEKAETINTLTNEKWRILSHPISEGNNILGAVVVSYYNPEPTLIKTIDERLQNNLQIIDSSVTVENGEIKLKNFDTRNIDYSISFEVVDRFNKVLINNGRIPAFIDPSYVNKEAKQKEFRQIKDINTKEEFIVLTKPLYDDKKQFTGIIITGKSLDPMNNTMRDYLIVSGLVYLFVVLPLSFFAVYGIRFELAAMLAHLSKPVPKKINKLQFDNKTGSIIIDDMEIEIPFDTNQYYICKALFASPKKKWEQDELLEKLGEGFDANANRKVYDAVNAINKKSGIRLITYQDKRYYINPEFAGQITR